MNIEATNAVALLVGVILGALLVAWLRRKRDE